MIKKILNPRTYWNIVSKRNTRNFFINNYILLLNDTLRNVKIRSLKRKLGLDETLKNFSNNNDIKNIVDELNEDGYSLFNNFLSEEKIKNITIKLSQLYCNNRNNLNYDKSVKDFLIKDVDRNRTHVAQYYRHDLLEIDELVEIANDTKLLAIAQSFIGVKPTITNISAWWSLSGRESATEAQNFHRDKDGVKFLKFFIYLTDVDKSAGPHVYIKGSSRYRMLRSPLHARYSDKEIYRVFPKDREVIFTAKAGDAFFEDTFGLHKGFLPESTDRLLLQIEYGAEEILWEDYSIKINNKYNYDKYINRFILKQSE